MIRSLRGLACVAAIIGTTACTGLSTVPVGQLNRLSEPSSAPVSSPSPPLVPAPTAKPKPSPLAVAIKPPVVQTQRDCTKVVYRYFRAQSNGSTVTLTWSTSGACTPVSGFIAGTYGAFGHWDKPVTTPTGMLLDTPPPLPAGTNFIYCVVRVYYVLQIQGTNHQATTFADNVRVC